jgi:hypothetical protein
MAEFRIDNIEETDIMDNCDDCGRSVYIEDLDPCPECKLYLCEDCQDEHNCQEDYHQYNTSDDNYY